MKEIPKIHRTTDRHWVGNGFPVRTLFSYNGAASAISPFLLLDYAGPAEFPPAEKPKGVGEHPHRGFETVTVVYQGEVEHRDSAGNHGKIGPGDVQWMTAASGIVHEEFHGKEFTRRGGMFQMAQLWVNLPAQYKISPPRYQGILERQIPAVILPDKAGLVRVIAGQFENEKGPAKTYTPIQLWDLRLQAERSTDFTLPKGYTVAIAVLGGVVCVNGSEDMFESDLVLLRSTGSQVPIQCKENALVLLMSGEPIDEPVVGQGPFVMNTELEINQAMRDYQAGRMGHLA